MAHLSPTERKFAVMKKIVEILPLKAKMRLKDLYKVLKEEFGTLSKPTLYAHLKTLVNAGVIRRIEIKGGVYYQKLKDADNKMLLLDVRDRILDVMSDITSKMEKIDVESILDKDLEEQEPFATLVRDCLKTLLKITYSVFGGEAPPEGKIYAFALYENQVLGKLVDAPKEDIEDEEPVKFKSERLMIYENFRAFLKLAQVGY